MGSSQLDWLSGMWEDCSMNGPLSMPTIEACAHWIWNEDFFYFWCLVLCITAIYFSSYIDQIVINIKLYFSYCSYSLIFSAHCKCVWLIVKLNNDDNWIFLKMLTQKFGKFEFIYINLIPRKIAKGKLYNPSDWQLSQLHRHRDGLTQDCRSPIDNALESPQPCAIDLYLGVIARKSR